MSYSEEVGGSGGQLRQTLEDQERQTMEVPGQTGRTKCREVQTHLGWPRAEPPPAPFLTRSWEEVLNLQIELAAKSSVLEDMRNGYQSSRDVLAKQRRLSLDRHLFDHPKLGPYISCQDRDEVSKMVGGIYHDAKSNHKLRLQCERKTGKTLEHLQRKFEEEVKISRGEVKEGKKPVKEEVTAHNGSEGHNGLGLSLHRERSETMRDGKQKVVEWLDCGSMKALSIAGEAPGEQPAIQPSSGPVLPSSYITVRPIRGGQLKSSKIFAFPDKVITRQWLLDSIANAANLNYEKQEFDRLVATASNDPKKEDMIFICDDGDLWKLLKRFSPGGSTKVDIYITDDETEEQAIATVLKRIDDVKQQYDKAPLQTGTKRGPPSEASDGSNAPKRHQTAHPESAADGAVVQPDTSLPERTDIDEPVADNEQGPSRHSDLNLNGIEQQEIMANVVPFDSPAKASVQQSPHPSPQQTPQQTPQYIDLTDQDSVQQSPQPSPQQTPQQTPQYIDLTDQDSVQQSPQQSPQHPGSTTETRAQQSVRQTTQHFEPTVSAGKQQTITGPYPMSDIIDALATSSTQPMDIDTNGLSDGQHNGSDPDVVGTPVVTGLDARLSEISAPAAPNAQYVGADNARAGPAVAAGAEATLDDAALLHPTANEPHANRDGGDAALDITSMEGGVQTAPLNSTSSTTGASPHPFNEEIVDHDVAHRMGTASDGHLDVDGQAENAVKEDEKQGYEKHEGEGDRKKEKKKKRRKTRREEWEDEEWDEEQEWDEYDDDEEEDDDHVEDASYLPGGGKLDSGEIADQGQDVDLLLQGTEEGVDEGNEDSGDPYTSSDFWRRSFNMFDDDDDQDRDDNGLTERDRQQFKLMGLADVTQLSEKNVVYYCSATGTDPKDFDLSREIKLPFFKEPLYEYQLFTVFWVLQLEGSTTLEGLGGLGGLVAHEPGLGKTRTWFALVVIALVLLTHKKVIIRDREAGTGRHLPEDCDESAVCPSAHEVQGKFRLRCICEHWARELFAGLSSGANLVVAPPTIVADAWIEEIDRTVNQEVLKQITGRQLKVVVVHGKTQTHVGQQRDRLQPHLFDYQSHAGRRGGANPAMRSSPPTRQDWMAMYNGDTTRLERMFYGREEIDDTPIPLHPEDIDHCVLLTAPHTLPKRYELWAINTIPPKGERMFPCDKDRWCTNANPHLCKSKNHKFKAIKWTVGPMKILRTLFDECHQWKKVTTDLAQTYTQIMDDNVNWYGIRPRLWLQSGTPFTESPFQPLGIYRSMQSHLWANDPVLQFLCNEDMREEFEKITKDYLDMVAAGMLTGKPRKVKYPKPRVLDTFDMLADHFFTHIFPILQAWCLKFVNGFMLHTTYKGKPLIDLPKMKCRDEPCDNSALVQEKLTSYVRNWGKSREVLADARQRADKHDRRAVDEKLEVARHKGRMLQAALDMPELIPALEEDPSLLLKKTLVERNAYVELPPELKVLIDRLGEDSGKVKALWEEMNKVCSEKRTYRVLVEEGEIELELPRKLVIVADAPLVNLMVDKWAAEKSGYRVAALRSGSPMITLIPEFQLAPHTIVDGKAPNNIDILVVAPRVAAEGVTLTRATTMVMYDVDTSAQRVEQVTKRIHRLGQTEETEVIQLISTEHNIQKLMVETRDKKRELGKLLMTENTVEARKAGPEVVVVG